MTRPIRYRQSARSAKWRSLPAEAWTGLALLTLLLLAFALGGSARADVPQLLILRPAAVLALGFALATVSRRHVAGFGAPVALALTAVFLPALQLLPLPPEVWRSLPGRALVAEVDAAAGLGSIWRPLTLTPPETLNALLAGLVPLAVLLLAIQLPAEQQARLVLVALALGGLSALIGFLQLLGDPQGALYFFEVTNNGAAVGLFANRNHQAVLLACMIPLAFAAAGLSRRGSASAAQGRGQGGARPLQGEAYRPRRRIAWPMLLALAATAMLVPLILITGSRSGLLMGTLTLLSLPLVLPQGTLRRGAISRGTWLGVAALLTAGLALAAIWLDRDLALDRLFQATPFEDLRLRILPTLLELAREHWLWGTGLGSFERVYQVREPAALLLPVYVNHAHNDWLELVITGGLPAVVLVVLGLGALVARLPALVGSKEADALQPLRRAALVSMVLLGLASISDYPLRTPALAALFALCALWLFMPRTSFGSPAADGLDRPA
ncbi:MAG: O-antigen ligase family protein [Rhodobacteraceae bacterium]|nr:O-antigen ligase family protein [Paracoccaceae bacterium]